MGKISCCLPSPLPDLLYAPAALPLPALRCLSTSSPSKPLASSPLSPFPYATYQQLEDLFLHTALVHTRLLLLTSLPFLLYFKNVILPTHQELQKLLLHATLVHTFLPSFPVALSPKACHTLPTHQQLKELQLHPALVHIFLPLLPSPPFLLSPSTSYSADSPAVGRTPSVRRPRPHLPPQQI